MEADLMSLNFFLKEALMINLIRTRNFNNRASCRFELSISIYNA